MPILKDKKLDLSRFTGIFKGKPKTGKSLAYSTFPKPMYVFDLDDRMLPLVTYYKDHQDVFDGIEYDTYKAGDYEKVAKKMTELEKSNKFATIVIDSLTTLSNMIMNHMLESRGGSTRKSGKEFAHKGIVELYEVEDYGGEIRALQDTLDFGFSLKCNFIIVAHIIETVTRNIMTNEDRVNQQLLTAGKKIAAALPAQFDEVWHFQKKASIDTSKPTQYEILTDNAGEDFAGTARMLPKVINWTDRRDLYPYVQTLIGTKK